MHDIVSKTDIRRQRVQRRLGSNAPQCCCRCCCGGARHNPRCLELHHLADRTGPNALYRHATRDEPEFHEIYQIAAT